MTVVLRADDPRAVDEAARALRAGQVVALPTDTLYGLCADPFQPRAIDAVFALKQRPRDFALPVLIAAPDDVHELTADLTADARHLIDAFWPGALTIVVPMRPRLKLDVGIANGTIAVRCPDHDVLRAVCHQVGPVAVTSANIHGEATPPTADAVAVVFDPALPLVLDAGVCAGVASTIADCTTPAVTMLRAGRVAWADIEGVLARDR
jgi:tRNA threonylcarbamoyl adenosine modification protein (Sua5/YciO/YrdC/YwlC family)